ncbi:MAG: rod shape-determining protein MreC [bacterium]|nr:rod shape-determining protein MreC [bacterium]
MAIYRKKRRTLKKFFMVLIVIIFLIGLVFFQRENVLMMSTLFQDVGSEINKLFLPKKIDYTNITSLQEQALEAENEELKKLLSLKTTISSSELVFGLITSRHVDYWFDTVIIDKGQKDGVNVDMVAINDQGLVGKVVASYPHSSKVQLLSANDPNNKIAVDIVGKENTYKGIISGYDFSKNYILVTSIRSTSNIQVGDTVMTNGVGALFPSQIAVGTVEEILTDDLGVSKVLGVSSAVDFENVRYLAILGKENQP